jgi:DNA end-binding protein Ku
MAVGTRVAREDVMPRAMWKGAIAFGLVTIPVGLYSATERSEKLTFHLLHKKDGSRIDYKRFCVKEDDEVPWNEIAKGYEYAKGKYVMLADADFEKARTPATETFDIRVFVNEDELDFRYFDTPYYLAPSGKSGVKAYALLRDALKEAGRVGVGTIVLRQREHLAALEPVGAVLVLTTMRFAHEIRSPKELGLPSAGRGYKANEMKLAQQLIDTLAGHWEPEAFKDTYTDVLRQVIKQKAQGKEITIPEPEKRPPVSDLVKALQESLKAGPRPLAKAAGRRAAKRPRRATRRLKQAA